jgi:hypothetical protein
MPVEAEENNENLRTTNVPAKVRNVYFPNANQNVFPFQTNHTVIYESDIIRDFRGHETIIKIYPVCDLMTLI